MQGLIDGKYEVLTKIKEGGMGAIYKVRHVLLDEVRVVKVMRPDVEDDPEVRRRFLKEARLATNLKHPHIAAVLDFVEDRNTFYMVMEYIDGVSLSEMIQVNGPLGIGSGLDLGIQVLDALEYLHRRGIVHRDVSPENVMLTAGRKGEIETKLIDLGIAKDAAAETQTMTGVFLGKLKYASPEQLGALRPGERIDGRSDIYSFGCVLYRALTGRYTHEEAETPQAWMLRHLRERPLDFEETDPTHRIPDDVRSVLLKSLEKSREERWATAEEFGAALLEVRAHLPLSSPDERTIDVDVAGLLAGSKARAATVSAASGTGTLFTTQLETVKKRVAEERKRAELENPEPAYESLQRELEQESPLEVVPGQKRIGFIAGASALFLIALVVFGLWFRNSARSGSSRVPALPGTATVPDINSPPRLSPGVIRLTASPWGEVVSIYDETKKSVVDVGTVFTPARVELPPGRYTIRVRGETGRGQMESEASVAVLEGRESPVHIALKGFEPEGVIRALVP